MKSLLHYAMLALGIATAAAAQDGRPIDGGDGSQPAPPGTRPSCGVLTLIESHDADGAHALLMAGGRPGEIGLLVLGCEPSAIDLPTGGQVRVRPDLVLTIGEFGEDGVLKFVPSGPRFENAGCVGQLAQAVALDAERMRTRVSDPLDLGPNGDSRTRLEARLITRETAPPTYQIAIRKRVDSTGHRLQLDGIERDAERGVTRIHVRHVQPDGDLPELPVRSTIRLRVDLGTEPGCRIEILLRGPDGAHDVVAELSGPGGC